MNVIEQSLLQIARDQLLSYPQVNPKEKLKYIIKRVCRKQVSKTDRFFWSHALLAQALETAENIEHNEETMYCLQEYYRRWLDGKRELRYIDNVMNGYTLLFLYEKTNQQIYADAGKEMYQYILQGTRAADGSISYRKSNTELIFADSIGMICPFLCRYGAVFKENQAIDLAITQINLFMQHGMDSHTGLPYHGYHAVTGEKKGIIGWGRAVGWLLLGMVDSIEYLKTDEIQYQDLVTKFVKLIDAVLPFWQEKRGFTWQITSCDGAIDTSAMGMILYAIEKGIKLGILTQPMYQIAETGKTLLKQYIKNGQVEQCSGECIDFGMYSQKYGAFPWSLGPVLRFLLLGEKE